MAETGKIRKKRNKFSQVSNHCLRNDKLSLKAKGLYALIQSFIDIPDFTLYKSVLMDKYCVEGREAFNNTWKELINAGYLKTYKINTHNGFAYEYELLDEPEEEEASGTPTDEGSGVEEKKPIATKVRQLSPGTENPYVGPGTAFPDVDSPGVGNPSLINTNNINIYKNNTNLFNYDDSNNLKDSKDTPIDIVVEEKPKPNKKSNSFSQSEIEDAEIEHLLINKNLDPFKTKIGREVLNLAPETLPYLADFASKYTGKNASIRMFKVEHLIHRYMLHSEACRSQEIADKAVNLLNDVAESFVGDKRYEVLNFSGSVIRELYDQAIQICDPDEHQNSFIVDRKAYLARIFHSVLAREKKPVLIDVSAPALGKEFY